MSETSEISKTIDQPIIKKRPPGRPPKNMVINNNDVVKSGIMTEPINKSNCIEFLYMKPVIFKDLFKFFKSIFAQYIQFIFRSEEIIIYCIDNHKQTQILVKIDATKVNSYFCRNSIEISVDRNEMLSILNKIDKTYTSITISSNNNTSQQNIMVSLKNSDEVIMNHQLSLISNVNSMNNEYDFMDTDYMIHFKLKNKIFKQTILDIRQIAKQFDITQDSMHDNIILKYISENKRIISDHIIGTKEKIELESKLQDDESFRLNLNIETIKPLATEQIADDIHIYIDENKQFMTKSYLDDNCITIITLTNLSIDSDE